MYQGNMKKQDTICLERKTYFYYYYYYFLIQNVEKPQKAWYFRLKKQKKVGTIRVKGTLQNCFFANKTVAGSVSTLCNPPYT